MTFSKIWLKYTKQNLPFQLFLNALFSGVNTFTLLCNYCHHPSTELLSFSKTETLYLLNDNSPFSSGP